MLRGPPLRKTSCAMALRKGELSVCTQARNRAVLGTLLLAEFRFEGSSEASQSEALTEILFTRVRAATLTIKTKIF